MRRFVIRAMQTTGTAESHAEQLADVLVLADRRGQWSHGVNRLHIYMEDTMGE